MQTRRLWRSKFRAAENAIILATTKSSTSRSHPSINLFMHFNNGSRFSLRLFFGLGLHIKIGLPRINRVRLPPNHRPFPLPCPILSAFFPPAMHLRTQVAVIILQFSLAAGGGTVRWRRVGGNDNDCVLLMLLQFYTQRNKCDMQKSERYGLYLQRLVYKIIVCWSG